jgi:hypothetical protein
MAWSALGAFEGNIVGNGGPYRVRFVCIAMLMIGGGLGAVLASLASPHLAWTLVLTAVFSFVITYLRAAGPSFTTSSAIILVVYFVGLDHPSASLAGALSQAGLFLCGCAFAAILSLLLWPVYPFGTRPGGKAWWEAGNAEAPLPTKPNRKSGEALSFCFPVSRCSPVVKALEKGCDQRMYAKVREHGAPVQGARLGGRPAMRRPHRNCPRATSVIFSDKAFDPTGPTALAKMH